MSNDAMVAVIIRVVGLLGGLFALNSAAAVWRLMGSGIDSGVPVVSLLAVVLWLVLSAIMIIIPLSLARILMPASATGQKETKLDLEAVRSIVLAALGLYLIFVAFSSLGSFLYFWPGNPIALADGQVFIGPVIRFVVGLWLLTGAKGLGGLLRTTGNSSSV